MCMLLTMVQVSNNYLEICTRSCRDTNSTLKGDRHTDIYMTKGKTICPPPLRGGGLKTNQKKKKKWTNKHMMNGKTICPPPLSGGGMHKTNK